MGLTPLKNGEALSKYSPFASKRVNTLCLGFGAEWAWCERVSTYLLTRRRDRSSLLNHKFGSVRILLREGDLSPQPDDVEEIFYLSEPLLPEPKMRRRSLVALTS
jgi:hypothetical protein